MGKVRARARTRQGGVESVRTLDRWMYWAYLALVVLVPLAFSRTPLEWLNPTLRGLTFDQFDIAKIVTLRFFTLLVLALWVAKLFMARQAKLRFTPLDVAILAFLFFATISTIFSWHFPTSLHGKFKRYEGLLTYINYALLYFLALQTFYNERRLKTLAKAMAITGGLVAVYGVAQFVGWDVFQWASLPFEQHRSFSTFGNPDLLAGYLVIALPFSVACLLMAKGWRETLLYSATTALLAVNVLTSLVRGAWIATVAVFLVFLGYTIYGYVAKRVSKESLVRVGVMSGVFILICIVVTLFAAKLGEPNLNIVERVKSMTKITEGSAGARIEIWKAGLSMVKSSPLIGLGPDTYRLGSERYETFNYVKTGLGKTVSDNAHNYILQLASGPGTLATISFLFLTLAIFAFSAVAVSRQSTERLVITTGFLAAGVGYFVHLFFGVSVSGSTSLFWLVLGVLVGQTAFVREYSFSPNEALNKVIIGLVVFTSAISLFYSAKMIIADYYYATGLSKAPVDTEAAINNYKTAISLYSNGRYYDSLGTYYLQLYGYRKDPEDYQRSVETLKEAVEFEPLEADHRVFLANTYLMNPTPANLAEARKVLESTLKIRARSVPARFLYAETNRMEQKYTEAIESYQETLKYDENSDAVLLGLARSYEAVGKRKEALASYQRLVSIKPGDKTAVEAIKRLQ
ncbi:MAG: O-antigen ligase family protein [Actinobacteria bacterium]|nr:O-antigen ligase family protein [Actinomycetota bacterium]